MRTDKREGAVPVFANDSTTSPDNTALLGMTVPATKVAAMSLHWIFVPGGVLPATTLSCNSTGNCSATAAVEVDGVCWLNRVTLRSTKSCTSRVCRTIAVAPCGLMTYRPIETKVFGGRGISSPRYYRAPFHNRHFDRTFR